MRLPKVVRSALEATGKPWEVVLGKKHHKIKVNGKLAGILPRGKLGSKDRALKNIVAQIKRAGNETHQRDERCK